MTDSAPTFTVVVEGVGQFLFSRRTMRTQIAIRVEMAKMTQNVDVGETFGVFVEALATIKVLAVETPDGWDPENADPFEKDSFDRVILVWGALRDKEDTFLKRPAAPLPGGGTTGGNVDGVLVPPEVSAGADGPPIP